MIKKRNHAKGKAQSWFVDWTVLARTYLVFAKLGLLELEKKLYQQSAEYGTKIYGFDITPFDDKTILVPIVWSVSHALELFLKALDIRVDGYFLNREHDKTELLKSLKLRIKDESLSSDIASLENLIAKYQSLSFWDNKLLRSQNIADINNSALRYPESNINFRLPLEVFHTLTEQELGEIKADIRSIEKLFSSFNRAIAQYKIKKGRSVLNNEAYIRGT
jgi:hypothetical protein